MPPYIRFFIIYFKSRNRIVKYCYMKNKESKIKYSLMAIISLLLCWMFTSFGNLIYPDFSMQTFFKQFTESQKEKDAGFSSCFIEDQAIYTKSKNYVLSFRTPPALINNQTISFLSFPTLDGNISLLSLSSHAVETNNKNEHFIYFSDVYTYFSYSMMNREDAIGCYISDTYADLLLIEYNLSDYSSLIDCVINVDIGQGSTISKQMVINNIVKTKNGDGLFLKNAYEYFIFSHIPFSSSFIGGGAVNVLLKYGEHNNINLFKSMKKNTGASNENYHFFFSNSERLDSDFYLNKSFKRLVNDKSYLPFIVISFAVSTILFAFVTIFSIRRYGFRNIIAYKWIWLGILLFLLLFSLFEFAFNILYFSRIASWIILAICLLLLLIQIFTWKKTYDKQN